MASLLSDVTPARGRASRIRIALAHFGRVLAPNPSRERLLEENRRFASAVPSGARVLDAGSGDAPYAHLFRHAQYESADFVQVPDRSYSKPTYICDLASIPVEDARFDFIIFNQVMEHLPEPKSVVAELYRTLKSGGKLLYTAPIYFAEHEIPYDFYRYTQYGVRHIFSSQGFTVERLDWLEGYYGTLHYQLAMAAIALPLSVRAYGGGVAGWLAVPFVAIVKAIFGVACLVFGRLELRCKQTNLGHPKNYVAILIK